MSDIASVADYSIFVNRALRTIITSTDPATVLKQTTKIEAYLEPFGTSRSRQRSGSDSETPSTRCAQTSSLIRTTRSSLT